MAQLGQKAPDFTAPGSDGDTIKQYSLTNALNDGPTVLLFYPFDFSPVCADQLCSFRDAEWLTVKPGFDVWGIAPDSAYSHQQFIQKYDLNFPLLTDRLGEIAESYGVLLDVFEHHKAIPKRSIITVDSDQTIRYTWEAESQYKSPQIEDVEAALGWYDKDAKNQ